MNSLAYKSNEILLNTYLRANGIKGAFITHEGRGKWNVYEGKPEELTGFLGLENVSRAKAIATRNEINKLIASVTTKVVFRKYKEGEVIALFPLVPHDVQGIYCTAYVHIGQHCAADTRLVADTKRATPEEYAALEKELEQRGYNLEIIQRIPVNAYQVRRAAIGK